MNEAWTIRSIDEVCTRVSSGGTPNRKAPANFAITDGHPWLKSAELLDCSVINAEERISDLGLKSSSAKYVSAGSVLMAMYGANVGQLGFLKFDCTLNQAICAMTSNTAICLPKFLYYSLLLYRPQLVAKAHGAAQQNLSGTLIRQFELPIPPVPTQRRIADILSAYDDLIENNTRRINILEDMARRLFEDWFGHEADGGDAAAVRIDTLIDLDPKTKMPKEGTKRFLPMPCVPTNSMVVSKWEEREGNAGSKFLNGDTLLARITPCLENGKTAYVDFLQDDEAGFGSTEFIVMRARSVPAEFVYCLARSDAFREHAIKSMSGATGRQRVSSAAVAQFEITSPNPEQLMRFGAAAEPMFSMIRSLADANTNLRATRDLLLPKLISGEIEVRAADEPLEAAAA